MTQQILICYSGSEDAERAVDTAATLLGPRDAVVLTAAPAMTFAESMSATSSVVPRGAFDDLNRADALRRAEAGATHARRAGLNAEARPTIASTTWQGVVDVAHELDVAAIVIRRDAKNGQSHRQHQHGLASATRVAAREADRGLDRAIGAADDPDRNALARGKR